jgi:hypothetical protein
VGGDVGVPITLRRPESAQARAFLELGRAVVARLGQVAPGPLPTIS